MKNQKSFLGKWNMFLKFVTFFIPQKKQK